MRKYILFLTIESYPTLNNSRYNIYDAFCMLAYISFLYLYFYIY